MFVHLAWRQEALELREERDRLKEGADIEGGVNDEAREEIKTLRGEICDLTEQLQQAKSRGNELARKIELMEAVCDEVPLEYTKRV